MPHGLTNEDMAEEADILALRALGWVLAEPDRARRLLDVTGLDPEALRGALGNRAALAAVLTFLENHEPDLIACANALDIRPALIGRAREALEQ